MTRTVKTCSIPDCGRRHSSRGWCYRHYQRWWKYGDPLAEPRKQQHGHARVGNMTAEYRIWRGMRQRCQSPAIRDYHRYGGRGIKVCKRWESFAAFLADVGPRPSPKHSIDRIDNDGDYEPGNVRWATAKEQQRNTDRIRHLTYQGETLTIPEWAERLGMPDKLIGRRIWVGWSVEAALTTPPLRRGLRAR